MKLIKKIIAAAAALSILLTYNLSAAVFAADTSSDTSSSEAVSQTTSENGDAAENPDGEKNAVELKKFHIDELDMDIGVPPELMTVTRTTKENDPVFDSMGKTYNEVLSEMKEAKYYLLGYATDYSYQFTVEMHTDSESKDIYDFNLLTEDQLRAIKDSLASTGIYHSVSRPAHTQAIFFNLGIEYKGNEKVYYGAQSYTIINGMHITITFQSFSGSDLTDEQYAMFADVLKSVKFNKVTEKPDVSDKTDQYVIIIVIVALIVGIVLALVIVLTMYRKNTKALKSMEDELEDKEPEEDLRIIDVAKSLYRRINKKAFGYDGKDDEFIYDFDYSYIDNNETQFDISIDDINNEIERRKTEGNSDEGTANNQSKKHGKGKNKSKSKKAPEKAPNPPKEENDNESGTADKAENTAATETNGKGKGKRFAKKKKITDFDVFKG